MSLSEEITIHNYLNEVEFYLKHQEENESYEGLSQEVLDKAHHILSKNVRESFINFHAETIIKFCEIALRVRNRRDFSEDFVKLFFQLNQSSGQMQVRAFLIQAQIVAQKGYENQLKAEALMEIIQNALKYCKKAIELIEFNSKNELKDKGKYGFLIYNVSLCVYEILRPVLKQNWSKLFIEIVEKIDKMFEEIDEFDFNWRCRFTLILFQCLYDAGKPESFKVLEKLWDNTKKKGDCDFQDTLLKLKIHYGKENSALAASAKKDADAASPEKNWKVLMNLQMMKSGLIQEAQIEKELINLINSISSAVLPGQEMSSGSSKLNPIVQERLAEAGRVALMFNLVNIADSITNFLSKVRQPAQKAYILNEYNKAELLIKKAGSLIDEKTGMRLNSIQIKKQEVQRRVDALKILEKTMITNKKLNDPELIYEGAVLIWNVSLPFINQTYKQSTHKAFNIACSMLEMIQSSDHALRINFHLEIAKTEFQEDYLKNAETHIKKALLLDNSIPLTKITQKIDEGEDQSLYQRPYDRYLKLLQEKIRLKSNLYIEPKNEIEAVILELEGADTSNKENMRIEVLQKCFGILVNMNPTFYEANPDLVDEEIKKEETLFKQQQLQTQKQRKLLAGEIAKMAFDIEENNLAMSACQFVVSDEWERRNAEEMIIIQVECYYILAQCYTDMLLKEGYEIAFADPLKVGEDFQQQTQEETQLSLDGLNEEKKVEILDKKKKIVEYYVKGLKLAEIVQQTWLVFNGAIYIWNNYLPVFRNPTNDVKLLSEISVLLKEFFETMKNSLKELEKKNITDYDIDSKIQVFANIGLNYARIMEGKSQYDEVMKTCEALLLTPLNPHTRKLISSIKARVQGVAKTTGKAAAPDKKSQQQQQVASDSVIFDVVSQLEIIQNTTNKSQTQDLIKKCFDTLLTWQAKPNDETELELHSELWARLARLAMNEETILMAKYGLRCVQNSLSLLDQNADLTLIPPMRLRWYSLAEYLYSETLMRMLNQDTQEIEAQEKLMFHALKHAVEAANKGAKANINILVLDASKQIWNISAKLQGSAVNRKSLMKPIFSTIFYLKSIKENSEPDLVLLLCQLLFKTCLENEEYEMGENVVEMAFELVPKALQKDIWEAKMIFMSKQGKNELQAISNMKEADASLQAKIWIRLARASTNISKQLTAYQKAIEILQKEKSAERVEVLIELSEWLLRNSFDEKREFFLKKRKVIEETLLSAADILIDIEYEDDDEDDDDDDYNKAPTILSRSSRGKKSGISRSSKKSRQSHKSKKSKLGIENQLKGEKSAKSKHGSSSRLSRMTVRVTKTIKNKASKSIFSQREEEPNPDTLNCSHYERLMRIHVMLAMISDCQEKQLQYCLDAKFFLTQIFELSFKTLNQIDARTAQYSNIKDDGNKKADQIQQQQQKQQFSSQQTIQQKYQLPQSTEEWIKLQLSKEFLEKVKSLEDYNFMGKYVFERAELTYYYVNYLADTFQRYGLFIHAVPIYVFLQFHSKEILQNNFLQIATEASFAKLLFHLHFPTEAQQILNNNQFKKFKLTEQEKKNFLMKSESSKIHSYGKKAQEIGETQGAKPFIIKQIQPYQTWITIAKLLLEYSEISRAKELLQESIQHAKILMDVDSVAEIEHQFAIIYYLEGKFNQSLYHLMQAHKWTKQIQSWEKNCQTTCKTLKKANQFENIWDVLNQMTPVVEDLFKKFGFQKEDQNQNREVQQDNVFAQNKQAHFNSVEIVQCLNTLYLLQAKTKLDELRTKSFTYKKFQESLQIFQKFEKNLNSSGITMEQFEIIYNSFFKLSLFLEHQNYCKPQIVKITYKVFEKSIQKLSLFENEMRKILKYAIHRERDGLEIQGPLNLAHQKIKILISRCFVNMGILKEITRSLEFKLAIAKDKDNEEENQDENENAEDYNNFSDFGPLNEYLTKLTMKIDQALTPIQQRLNSYEKAIFVIQALLAKTNKSDYHYKAAKIEQIRAHRLLAVMMNQMNEIWYKPINVQENKQNFSDDEEERILNIYVDYKAESLEAALDFSQENQINQEVQLDNVLMSPYALYYSKLFNQEMMENFGVLHPDISFEFLAKYQHFSNLEYLQEILKSYSPNNYNPLLMQRVLKNTMKKYGFANKEIEQILFSQYKIWGNLYQSQTEYKEMIKNLLPNSSAYLVIQFSHNKLFCYIGLMTIGKKREQRFYCQKKKLDWQTHERIELIKKNISQMKSFLIKTPIITEEELKKMESEQNQVQKQIMEDLEHFSQFFTQDIDTFFNQECENEQNLDEADTKGTKQQQQQKDKKAKDQIQAYESPLAPTKSGIESLTILLDHNLIDLPFENLKVFDQVPAKSKDFSLPLLGDRYQRIQFNSALNNSIGINKEQLRYICYDFKKNSSNSNNNTNYNLGELIESEQNSLNNMKFQGINSDKRIASIGEWQKFLAQGSLQIFYGHPGFLDIVSPKLVLDMLEINNTKAFIIIDKINVLKTLIQRANKLDDNGEKIPTVEQPIKTAAFLTLLGVSSMAFSQWSIHMDEYLKIIKTMLKNINQGLYFAASINSYKEPSKALINENNVIIDYSKLEKELETIQQNQKSRQQQKKNEKPQKGKEAQVQQNEEQLNVYEDIKTLEELVNYHKLKEIVHQNERLYTDNIVFFGVPVLRLS